MAQTLLSDGLGSDPSDVCFWGGSVSELVLYCRWLVDQFLLGFAHIVYNIKGKRFTSEYWIVSRFSVRWSSTSTILTLMAWRSNIPQKSFLYERLSIPSLEWFVFYMQMVISTTGRRPLCILCSVSVLSKMLKLCSAEGSSFRLWWMLSARCCWGSVICVLVGCCQPIVAETASCWLSSDSLMIGISCLSVLMWDCVRWWACSGSNRLLLCFEGNARLWNHRWLFDEVSFWSFVVCWYWHSDLSKRSHCQNVGFWVVPRVSEDLCLDAIGHCECSLILLASRIAKVTLIGNFAG